MIFLLLLFLISLDVALFFLIKLAYNISYKLYPSLDKTKLEDTNTDIPLGNDILNSNFWSPEDFK